jgi:hypothetical protein
MKKRHNFNVGDTVKVIAATDDEMDSKYLGKVGRVIRLEDYADMEGEQIIVSFGGGEEYDPATEDMFWAEELTLEV